MKTSLTLLLIAGALAISQTPSNGAALGDPAAPLQISDWVKGDPVDLSQARGKRVIVVEFWATWCGPCLTSIPHLTEIQKRFAERGVVVVGISDEDPTTVRPFVQKMGTKMEYTVALDPGRQTAKGYMTAYGQNGIPHAFIVDLHGNIAWHGHPMAGLEDALDRIAPAAMVKDPAEEKREAAQRKLLAFIELAAQEGNSDELDQLASELTALDQAIGGIDPGQPLDLDGLRRTVRFQKLMRDYQRAVAAGGSEAELASIEAEAAPLAPDGFRFEDYRGDFSLQRTFQDYYRAVTRSESPARVATLTQRLELVESADPAAMNEIAWTLLTDTNIKIRNLALALQFAQRAYDLTEGKDADVVDTYARALFENGRTTEAIRQQERAIALTDDQSLQTQMQVNLERYQARVR